MIAYVTRIASWQCAKTHMNSEDIAIWAGDRLLESGFSGDGLYVATLGSGAAESVRFWRDAKETGLRFANPRAFPWTLCNAPTGHMAQRLGIRGPTYTVIGGSDALAAAMDHAMEDLRLARTSRALVATLDESGTHAPVLGALALMSHRSSEVQATVTRRPRHEDADDNVVPSPNAIAGMAYGLGLEVPYRLLGDRWLFEVEPAGVRA